MPTVPLAESRLCLLGARAADGQVVKIKDRDGLSARSVEVEGAAGDRVSVSAGKECAATLIVLVESSVIARPLPSPSIVISEPGNRLRARAIELIVPR